jgi:hypothetical protein
MNVYSAIVRGASIVLVWCGAIAYAGAPMGIPAAMLEEGQWSVGLGYGYGEIDWEAYGLMRQIPDEGSPTYTAESIDLNGVRVRTVLGTLAYGICDTWDVFLHLGAADVRDNFAIGTTPDATSECLGFDGDAGLAWGFGTRATFCQWGPWRFGGLVQMTWFAPQESDFSSPDRDDPNAVNVGTADMEFWETQVAIAAVYQIDTLRFWAGPFLQFVQGDLSRHGRTVVEGSTTGRFHSSADIEEDTRAGVQLGVHWEASTRTNVQVEGQFTADSWFVGLSGVIRPDQWFGQR